MFRFLMTRALGIFLPDAAPLFSFDPLWDPFCYPLCGGKDWNFGEGEGGGGGGMEEGGCDKGLRERDGFLGGFLVSY